LSGKLNNNLRIGLMNMQTDPNSALKTYTKLFDLGSSTKVFSRSNIGLMFLNKEALNLTKIKM
jgi:hypothetical protein